LSFDLPLSILFALATISSALGMIVSKKMMYCVILMGVLFTEIFALFILLNAEYLAVVQLLVYAGAVTVLFIFALMLTRGEESA